VFDIIIIGGGAAAASAALTAKSRGKSVAAVANGIETTALWRAELISNYPGTPDITGRELASAMRAQLEAAATVITGRALSIMPMGDTFGAAVENEFCMARAVIIAAGITREKLYRGEAEFLGRGVSYCATCDGMLYRGKKVALIGSSDEARRDGDFLESIGCEVVRLERSAQYEISGEERADTVSFSGESIKVDGVFIIKDTVSVAKLVPGIEYKNGGIVTDGAMATSVPGVFAAGDCRGKPFQLAKAAGEGNIAALSACEYIDSLKI